MRRMLCLIGCCSFFLAALSSQGQTPGSPSEPYRTAGDRPIDIEHIRLDLRVDLPKKTVDAVARLRIRSMRALDGFSLDAVDFHVSKVVLENGSEASPVRHSHDGKKLHIELNPSWPAGRQATLRIDYQVREPKEGLYFFGPSAEEPDVPHIVWSQGESITNRYWIPCLDQPNQRQTTEMAITVEHDLEAVSNGKLLERRENSDKTVTFHWLQDKPHPSYLITLVVGPFDVVGEEWHGIPVQYFVPKGHRDEVARTFGRTKEMLSYFSQRFGVRYPWDKYAQIAAEQYGGGMENTSATTLTPHCLLDERSLLDGDSDGLISHELAHQWWGDLLTCRDWSDLWLNEGFASYAEALWDEHAHGRDAYAYNMWQKSPRAIEGGKTRPVVDHRYPTPDSMFDGRSYPKGAWILHMLRQRLGEDAFWQGIKEYATTYRLQSVETADLRRTMEKVSGRDLDRFFFDWTERPGNPVIDIRTEALPASKAAQIVVKQTQPGEAFAFPLAIAFSLPSGSKPIVVNLEVQDKEQTFLIPLVGERPTMIEIDPDHAVLGELTETKGRDWWVTQLHHGSTVVSRIRAAHHLGKTKSSDDRQELSKALAQEKAWGVQVEIANALGASGGDEARQALIAGLQLPDARVRRACAEQLGNLGSDAKAAAALRMLLQKGDASYAVEAAALQAYAKLRQADALAVLLPWLEKPSHHETLRSGALAALGETRGLSTADVGKVIAILKSWNVKGKPRECRTAALGALGRWAEGSDLKEAQRQEIIRLLADQVKTKEIRLRFTAIQTLQRLGRTATAALPALDELVQSDSGSRFGDMAKRAADHIRSVESGNAEVKQLREQLDQLRREQNQLKDRLNKYEKSAKKAA